MASTPLRAARILAILAAFALAMLAPSVTNAEPTTITLAPAGASSSSWTNLAGADIDGDNQFAAVTTAKNTTNTATFSFSLASLPSAP